MQPRPINWPSVAGKLQEMSALKFLRWQIRYSAKGRFQLTNLAATPQTKSHSNCNGTLRDFTPFIDRSHIRLIKNSYGTPTFPVWLYLPWQTLTDTTFHFQHSEFCQTNSGSYCLRRDATPNLWLTLSGKRSFGGAIEFGKDGKGSSSPTGRAKPRLSVKNLGAGKVTTSQLAKTSSIF